MRPKNLEVEDIWEGLAQGEPPGRTRCGQAVACAPSMKAVLVALFASLRASLRRRVALQLEILALRHQLAVYRRHHPRTRIQVADRLLWSWLSRAWAGWRSALVFVQPSTVIAWQRRRFRDHWASLSRRAPGRPAGMSGS